VRYIIELLLACATITQTASGMASHDDSSSVLLLVNDWETYLHPIAGPNNVGNCLIVYSDGRVHLELRRQEFLGKRASFGTYIAVLSKRDLASLHSILDSAEVRKLPELRLPKLPLESAHFGWFTAEIYSEGATHKVGYPFWEGEPKPTADERSVWEEQRVALQPLIQWSRAVKSFPNVGWRRARNANSECPRDSCEGPEDASVVIGRIMSSALARCFSRNDGVVKGLTFVPPTNEEVVEVKSLGDDAIAPLASYVDAKSKDDFTQLFAVRFLMALHSPDTFPPLARAFGRDHWEVTRQVALNAMFAVSEQKAKPHVRAALSDESNVVKQSAVHLWSLYKADDH
jgi:hypothetical protein